MKATQMLTLLLAAVMLLAACTAVEDPAPTTTNAALTVGRFDDIRVIFPIDKAVYEADEFRPEDLITLTFNESVILKESEELQAQILEAGKNPGLGVRALHEQGLTGQGVNVAIIDQNLLLNHPEFAGKIAAYYDTGCEQDANSGSMHAPAVTGILVGENIGVAPGARVYFAAAPSWKRDSEYYAKGLYWIIEENDKLPENEKIRVVSVSAAPSGEGSPFEKNLGTWDEAVLAAQEAGILVLDCRKNPLTGVVGPAFYDPEHPEDISLCQGGFPSSPYKVGPGYVCAPASYRTVAEEYYEGQPSYQYTGVGGLSWGIPYAAGVLALGWQINPQLNGEEMVQILCDTAAPGKDGSSIINPAAFIEAVKATLN